MRNLTATLFLTLTLFLGSIGVSESADYQKRLTAAQSGDFATALREWKPLAEQGYADAQYALGAMYTNGHGVPQDDKTAVKWDKLAAEDPLNYYTHYKLGELYLKGKGTSEDIVRAHIWMNVAIYVHGTHQYENNSKYQDALELRDQIEMKMSSSRIKKAQDLARECVLKKYKGC
jgi:TPR repeat protein